MEYGIPYMGYDQVREIYNNMMKTSKKEPAKVWHELLRTLLEDEQISESQFDHYNCPKEEA